MLQALSNSCGAKTTSKNVSKMPSSKRQKTLEPLCKSSKKYTFAKEAYECIINAVENTKFVFLTEGQEYEDLVAENQERLFLKLSNADKAAYFKEEDVQNFRKLAQRFLHKANYCLRAQFKDDKFSLEKAIENDDLEAHVAAHFEHLVKYGVADENDADVAWVCPKGHDEKYKRFCDCEDVNEETLEGEMCFAPLCIKCHPQQQDFDVCQKCNNPADIQKMKNMFVLRQQHAKRETWLEDAKKRRVILVEEYKNKEPDPWYHPVNKKALFKKLGIPEDTKRPYTQEEARYGAMCFGPAHETKTKIKYGPLPPKPEKTIRFKDEQEKMNATAVLERVDDNLKLANEELNKKSPDLDKVDKALDAVQDLLTAGKTIVLKDEFDRCNAKMQQYEKSVDEKRNPLEPVGDEEPEETYGSGGEDDEEEEDGHDETDLLNEKLREQDELDLMKLLESDDDEM
jgi:hypothetical protein